MSSFRNAAKSNQKTHRERSQPAARQHLGLLEKKKDYKKRADDFHKKQEIKKVLMRKALDKNPDEFYFKMIRTRMKDGEHQCESNIPKYTEDQRKLMQSQDIRYVNFKRSLEQKKIERLKASLHLLDVESKPKNKHVVFVDSRKEAAEFNPSTHLNTHPALLDRTYNRPTLDSLKKMKLNKTVDDEAMLVAAVERKRLYDQLCKRIEREKQLTIIAQKMETKKILLDKKVKKKKVADETVETPAVYRQTWKRKR
jgi:U3 small nucleolar RNA-associated protein 11